MIEPPSSTPIQMQPSSSKLPLVLVGFILLLAAGAGGVYLGKYLYGSKDPPIVTNVPPTPRVEILTATPTPDVTANWETYTNVDFGYSLKYPKTWRFQAASEGCGPVFFYPNSTKIWLTICGPYINQDDTPEEMANRSVNSPPATLESREQVLIDNHSGIRQVVKTGDIQLTIEIYVGGVTSIMKYTNGQSSRAAGTLAIYYYIRDLDKLAEAMNSFDQILSTFRFLDGATPTPTTTVVPQRRRLTYALPNGWKTVVDTTGMLEVGYDPERYEVSTEDKRINLSGIYKGTQGVDLVRLGWNKHFYLITPSGKSRHGALYKILNVDGNSASWKSPTYYAEREYSYSGWNCLVINGVDISQYPVAWGYCPISASQALVLAFDGYDWSEIEQQIATVKLLR